MLNNSAPHPSNIPPDLALVQPVPLFAVIGQADTPDGKIVVQLKMLCPNGAMVFLLDAAQATTLFTTGLEVARMTQAGLRIPE